VDETLHEDAFWIGRHIGPYEVVGLVDTQGTDHLFRAVRAGHEFKQEVSIRLGSPAPDPTGWLARFNQIRPALAALEHPDVARLLDGGITGDGRPYWVMEAVQGQPIDRHCNGRGLSIKQRLALFRTVCMAVHAGHQHLILHGGLRPESIVVAPEGGIKLLDTGLAALDDAVPPLEYASPEQARGEPLTTASDVYALGVLLYRLLTGLWPYLGHHTADPALPAREALRVVCELPAERPSQAVNQRQLASFANAFKSTRESHSAALSRRLRGDLDAIVLMTLYKEPHRRYRTAEQLARDIGALQEHQPVAARPNTALYRSAKFIGRHPVTVLSTMGLASALVVGALLAGQTARTALAERDRAERHFQSVRALANVLMFDIHDGVAKLPAATPGRLAVVRASLRYLDPLAREADADPALKRELAVAFEKMGDTQGGYRLASLGDTAGAIASYRKSLTVRESLLALAPDERPLLRDVIRNHGKLGELIGHNGDRITALEHARMLLRMAERLLGGGNTDLLDRRTLAAANLDYGWKLARSGPWERGLEHCHTAIAMMEQMVRETPGDTALRRTLAITYGRVADTMLNYSDRYGMAQDLHQRALAETETLLSRSGSKPDLIAFAAWTRLSIGQTRYLQNDIDEAMQRYQQALVDLRALSNSDPGNQAYRIGVATALSLRGGVLLRTGNINGALDQLELAQADFSALPADVQHDPDQRLGIALHKVRLADVHAAVLERDKKDMRVQAAYRQPALDRYGQALPILLSARKNGNLRPDQQALPEHVIRMMKRLDPVIIPPEAEAPPPPPPQPSYPPPAIGS
jgi:tetratricopeptide (TPR) repeat protein